MRQEKIGETITKSCNTFEGKCVDLDTIPDPPSHDRSIIEDIPAENVSSKETNSLTDKTPGHYFSKENEECSAKLKQQRSCLAYEENQYGDLSILANGTSSLKTTRKWTVLKIDDGVSFCKIVTVVYQLDKETAIQQHYVTDASEQVYGDIGLRENDELVEVNGRTLMNKSQAYVINTFRTLKLDCVDPDIQMNLTVYRWNRSHTSDTEYSPWNKRLTQVINLTLVPLNREKHITYKNLPIWLAFLRKLFRQDHIMRLKVEGFKERTSHIRELPRGNIEVKNVYDHPPLRKHILICDNRKRDYIHWNCNGLLYPEVLRTDEEGLFYTEIFTGYDTSLFPFSYIVSGYRFFCWIDGRKWYLCFDKEFHVSCKLCEDDKIATNNMDERCFILRADGRQCFLQSAVVRDRFLSFDSGVFTMKRIETYKLFLVSKGVYVKDFITCRFSVVSPDTLMSVV